MKVSIGDKYIYRVTYKSDTEEKMGTVTESGPHKIVLAFTDGSEIHYPRHQFMRDMYPVLTRYLEKVDEEVL